MQPTFLVKVLPRESQVEGEGTQVAWVRFRCRNPKRFSQPAPSWLVVFIDDDLGRVEGVGMDEIGEWWVGSVGRVGCEDGYWDATYSLIALPV
jgi:hypothetical protein